jgi:hypothetical protein
MMGLFDHNIKIFVDGVRVDVEEYSDGTYSYKTETGVWGCGQKSIEEVKSDARAGLKAGGGQSWTNWFGGGKGQ